MNIQGWFPLGLTGLTLLSSSIYIYMTWHTMFFIIKVHEWHYNFTVWINIFVNFSYHKEHISEIEVLWILVFNACYFIIHNVCFIDLKKNLIKDMCVWWFGFWVSLISFKGESNGTPLQYSCLENPMDGGTWWVAVHGVAESRTRLSDFTFTFHFHELEQEMATHSSILAWRIPGMGEPGGLLSMGLHRVGHDWSNLAAAAAAAALVSRSNYLSRHRIWEK